MWPLFFLGGEILFYWWIDWLTFKKAISYVVSMGFNDIPPVERSDFYLDVAFKKAKDRAGQVKSKKGPKTKLARIKETEKVRVMVVRDILKQKLMHTIKGFPQIDDLSLFYVELIRTTMDYKQLKLSLGALNWAIQKIQDHWQTTSRMIAQAR